MDEGQTEGRLTRSGASLKSPEVRGQPPPGRGKKRGRKRKAEESAFKISDFVDNQVGSLCSTCTMPVRNFCDYGVVLLILLSGQPIGITWCLILWQCSANWP